MTSKRKAQERPLLRIGDMQSLLQVSDAEAIIDELRASLGRAVKLARLRKRLSQETFARRIGSSQSRVAKMESGDASVALDLLIRTLLRLGLKRGEIGSLIAAEGER